MRAETYALVGAALWLVGCGGDDGATALDGAGVAPPSARSADFSIALLSSSKDT